MAATSSASRMTFRFGPPPSTAAIRRGAAAILLLAFASVLASVRSQGLAGWGFVFTALAIVLVGGGLAVRRARVVAAGVVVGGVTVAAGLIRRGGVDAFGAVEGTALLMAAELAWWSLEQWSAVPAEPGTDQPRWLTLSALAAAGLGLGLAASALAAGGGLARTRASDAVLEGIGAAAAVVVVMLVLAVAVRSDHEADR